MAQRISPIAPIGSLFKQAKAEKKRKAQPTLRDPRQHDAEHLEAIRQCPCLSCGTDPCSEAAHVRMTRPGKNNAGMGAKPHDYHAVPLCRECHMRQHSEGEEAFWGGLGVDPIRICEALQRVSPSVEAMRAACFVVHSIAGTKK